MSTLDLLRPLLLAAARSRGLERAITRVPLTRAVVDRFVTGRTEADVLAATRAILASGRAVTIDHLGEDTVERAQASATVEHYLALVEGLRVTRARGDDEVSPLEVSVKLTALGQSLPDGGRAVATENLRRICSAADAAGVLVTVDAEDHTTVDERLAIVREVRGEYPSLGTVLQAYLRRTERDCAEFAGAGSRIRLCKGAYREPAEVAYQERAEVDAAFTRCLRLLLAGRGYPMIATHDPAMIAAARAIVAETARTDGSFEFQMLYGIRDDEQSALASEGFRVRVYLPYGDEWYGYFVRRLAERPANLRFFLTALTRRPRRGDRVVPPRRAEVA